MQDCLNYYQLLKPVVPNLFAFKQMSPHVTLCEMLWPECVNEL